ncbi:MAG TPA: methyltransferase domain-containing protein [Verrucomicrobiae bacterium]|nr:methyltransferase domain-containing protein [Verrucomicrobiae bacterium]
MHRREHRTTIVTDAISCVVCSGTRFNRLADPHADRCIASDLRVLAEPLDKWQCLTCGAIRRGRMLAPEALFTSDYDLYAHDPGRVEEARRQAGYAAWLAAVLPVPVSVYEAGSGNGSLLLSLRERWSNAAMSGIEPAGDAAAAARRAGLNVATGFLREAQAGTERASLAVCVNVIEHTPEPVTFLRALASHGESVAIVCPDATIPNAELLFGDHIHSLRPRHLEALFAQAALDVDEVTFAPASLGHFQLVVGHRSSRPSAGDARAAVDDRHSRYLEAWRGLDRVLLERTGGERTIAFGAGEAAGLLRAYAPVTWSNVAACAVDAPDTNRFGELAVLDASSLEACTVLLAVRPAAQAAVAERLHERGHRVVRWDDVIQA